MAYESRFGCTKLRNDCRHDPGYAGIFIHGGTCMAGPFFNKWTANRFSITTPTKNRQGVELPGLEVMKALADLSTPQPTFQRALDVARELRRRFEALADCRIYACTDLQMDT